MPLAPYALTDAATVQAIPGLTTVSTPYAEQLINVASQKIANFCNRTFHYQTFSIANPDKVRSYGKQKLRLNVAPIAWGGTINTPPANNLQGLITQITQNNWPEDITGSYLVPQNEYEIDGQDGAEAGLVYRANGWYNSGLLEDNLNFLNRVQPGSEEATVWAVYSGGYITKPQSYGGAGGDGSTGTQWPYPGTGATVPLGQLLLTGTAPNQLLWQSVPNGLSLSTGDSADVTAGVQPSLPGGKTIGYVAVDGTVSWMYLGLAGAPGFAGANTVLLSGSTMLGGARITLPDDLEQACIEEVKARVRGSGRDPMAKTQTLLGTSVTYRDVTVSGLCPDAEALAKPWARIF